MVFSPSSLADRRRTADRIFRGALIFNTALTLFWAVMLATHGNAYFFTTYDVTREGLIRVFTGILFFNVIWGFIWYGVKTALLRSLAKFSKEEVRQVFSSRMRQPFDVGEFVTRHSERRIRIIDMIGRRGRFITLGAAGFFYLYSSLVVANPSPKFASIVPPGASLRRRRRQLDLPRLLLFGRVPGGGVLRRAVARDGRRARARELPAHHDAVDRLQIRDGAGRRAAGVALSAGGVRRGLRAHLGLVHDHRHRRRGRRVAVRQADAPRLGHRRHQSQVDRRNGVGVRRVRSSSACGSSSAAACRSPWIGLAVVIAVSNTLLELFSPRGTDDFTMATANALDLLGLRRARARDAGVSSCDLPPAAPRGTVYDVPTRWPQSLKRRRRIPYALSRGAIEAPPVSLVSALRRIGPGIVLAASIVGSGELIATTTLGAQVGYAALWIVLVSCAIKPVVQGELGRYTIAHRQDRPRGVQRRARTARRRRAGWSGPGRITVSLTLLQVGGMYGGVGQVLHAARARGRA